MQGDATAGRAPRGWRPGARALLAIFFISGLLSLTYQIVWSRLFFPVFGMNLPAITAVVAAFMGGLGLGAHLFGRLADRVPPWRTCALLEAGVGLSGILIPRLAGPCGRLFARLTPLGTPTIAVHGVRFIGVALLLAGPCLLMGGTFPVFARGFSRSTLRRGRDLGALYAWNTAGAACGCLLAGAWLLPRLGMDQISELAAAGNFLLAMAMWAAVPALETPCEGVGGERGAVGAGPGTILVILFLTGYLGLSFELLWTRALTQALGATYFSFALILAALLLGIFLGSAFYRAVLADREGRTLLATLAILLLLATASSFYVVSRLHPLLTWLRAFLPLQPGGLLFYVAPPLALCLLAFLPTAAILGAMFPMCLGQHAGASGHLGRDLGLAYGVNTAGAVCGVALTGLLTIDRIGSGGTLVLLFLLAAVAACLALIAAAARPARSAAALLIAALLVAPFLPRDIFFANQLACLRARFPLGASVLFRGEDATSMATLVESPGARFHYIEDGRIREGAQRNIYHSNWRGVGGTRIYAWNMLGAYLAGLLHPNPGEVLIIGYGSGRQLKTLASLTYPRRLDVVEVNRINFAASDYFYLDSGALLADPRVHVYVDDGRNHLLRSRQRYDVILVDVGGLQSDGAEFFYTREFLRLCRDHLRRGGLLFTWLDVGSALGPLGSMYQSTIRDVFPDASVWLGSGEPTSYGWLWLVGGDGPLSLDAARLRARWALLTATQRAELALAGVRDPLQLAALRLADLGAPSVPLAPGRILTDDRPYYRPLRELDNPPGASFANPGAYAAALDRLLDAGPAPSLAGAAPADRDAVEAHLRAFREMVRKGASEGPFRLPAAP